MRFSFLLFNRLLQNPEARDYAKFSFMGPVTRRDFALGLPKYKKVWWSAESVLGVKSPTNCCAARGGHCTAPYHFSAGVGGL